MDEMRTWATSAGLMLVIVIMIIKRAREGRRRKRMAERMTEMINDECLHHRRFG